MRFVVAATGVAWMLSAGAAAHAGPLDGLDLAGLFAGSVSCGHVNQGRLYNAVELPPEGEGYVIPDPWRSRGFRYATAELVGLIRRAAVEVAAGHPGVLLGVADLSRSEGGACPRHRSHQSGRDVDLLYYAVDAEGAPLPPGDIMPYYTSRGVAKWARSPVWTRSIGEHYFDVARNWLLVKALITDDQVEVERIFVSPRIERWLIRHAQELGEDADLIKTAQRLLHRPRAGESHSDHMHVRIACSPEDVRLGRCRKELARGRRRWRLRCPRPERPAPIDRGEQAMLY